MPKRTYKDLENLHGVTRNQLNAAKLDGVNIWNDEEAAEYLGSRRARIKPGTKISDQESAAAQTLEQIENAIRSAQDIDTVKILKEKVMALKGVVAVQVETRELISIGEVKEDIIKCVSASRAEFLKLSSDLPPKLAGLDEAMIESVVRDEVNAILSRLSASFLEIYGVETE
jgi:hypothetical protein